jgi:hypothetical protein
MPCLDRLALLLTGSIDRQPESIGLFCPQLNRLLSAAVVA